MPKADARVRVTRGDGLLEHFLAVQRAKKANTLIPVALRSGRILDYGCGSQPYFLHHTVFAEKHGVDPMADLELSSDITLQTIETKAIPSLPYADAYFDVVTMLAVFEHIEPEHVIPLLRECKRVLCPGGRLIITTPAPIGAPILAGMTIFHLVSKEEMDEHQPLYSRARVKQALVAAGFNASAIHDGLFEFGVNQWFTVDV